MLIYIATLAILRLTSPRSGLFLDGLGGGDSPDEPLIIDISEPIIDLPNDNHSDDSWGNIGSISDLLDEDTQFGSIDLDDIFRDNGSWRDNYDSWRDNFRNVDSWDRVFPDAPILETTSDLSNITLRSAVELGSTINVNPIELSTTFIPTTIDTRNLDFSNVSFPYLSTSNSNNLNSGLFPDYIINQRINPNAPSNSNNLNSGLFPDYIINQRINPNAPVQFASTPFAGELNEVGIGATILMGLTWAGERLWQNSAPGILYGIWQEHQNSRKLQQSELRSNSPTFGSIDLGNKNFPLPPDFVAIDPAQLNFSPNRISLTPLTGIQYTGHPSLSPEEARDLTQLGGFDLGGIRIPYDTAHDVYNDPKQFDPNTTFPFPTFDPNLSPFHTGHLLDLDFQPTYVFTSKRIGPSLKGVDWDHIFKNHAEWGRVAQQGNSRKNKFQNMSEVMIKASVKEAWKKREKIRIQTDEKGDKQILYRGYDRNTRYVIEIWQNKETGIIRTAYPINN